MPRKKKGNATKRKPRQKTIKEHIPDEKFVTKFLAVMQRFPACTLGEMSLDDEFVVDTFFYRLVQFTNRGENRVQTTIPSHGVHDSEFSRSIRVMQMQSV